jgi:hypothetical protein
MTRLRLLALLVSTPAADAVTWVTESNPTPSYVRDAATVVHDNKLFVMGGASGFGLDTVMSSTDGSTWVTETTPLPDQIYGHTAESLGSKVRLSCPASAG